MWLLNDPLLIIHFFSFIPDVKFVTGCSQKNNLNTHMALVHEGKIVHEGKEHFKCSKCVFSSIDANNVIQREEKLILQSM